MEIGRRPESPAASITRCRPQAKRCRLPAMSGETRGKTPRPKVKGNCAVPLALRRTNSMKKPLPVRTKKSQGAGAVSVAGVRARLSPPLSRSRPPSLPRRFRRLASHLFRRRDRDSSDNQRSLSNKCVIFSSPAPALPRLTEARPSRDPPLFACDAVDA